MTSTQKLYDQWSATYDSVENKTRDLERHACRTVLSKIAFTRAIELGAGTGKNTQFLAERAEKVLSVDFSEEMQAIARTKVKNANVEFLIADVRQPWKFDGVDPDLITCSLILEHVEDLSFVFEQMQGVLVSGGHLYICELHPFKQYEGSKARFEAAGELLVTDCYRHHVTDYTDAALKNGFAIERIDEWFDEGGRETKPRLISFVFEK